MMYLSPSTPPSTPHLHLNPYLTSRLPSHLHRHLHPAPAPPPTPHLYPHLQLRPQPHLLIIKRVLTRIARVFVARLINGLYRSRNQNRPVQIVWVIKMPVCKPD